jgi:ribonuclease P protein component
MRVRRTGKSYAHPLIILIASPNKSPISRFGVSASKAVGGAVSRNRAKRRIRAAVHPYLPTIKSGWDILLIARAPLVNAEWPRIEEAMDVLLKRAQLLDNEQ